MLFQGIEQMIAVRFQIVLTIAAGLSACSTPPRMDLDDTRGPGSSEEYLFRASNSIHDRWMHMPLRGETKYQIAIFGDQIAIRAVGQNSASGLIRRVAMDTELCPELEWAWNVAQLQGGANLNERDAEDVGASIILLFGDPGLMSNPKPVPTLRYVWTTDHVTPETIIDSPYMEGVVKSLVVRTGEVEQGTWYVQRRNLVEDFIAAFGHPPEDKVRAIAIFTDNDQTEEPVEAYYGWARAICVVNGVSVEEEIGRE